MELRGMRLAVAGMGVSGRAIAKAAAARGARVVVYDEKFADTEERMAEAERLQGHGVEVIAGWHGRLDPATFDVLVSSPGFKREHAAIRDAQSGGREVISEVEFAARIAKAPIVAITGTNGKSTTTVLTWLLLRGARRDAVLCGNISGSGYPEMSLTEAAAASHPSQVLVAEVSSYQLEWVRDFRPKAAAITNVTPDHLERHPSFEDYLETKLRIFDRMGEGDTAVLNTSEPPPDRGMLLRHLGAQAAVRTIGRSGREDSCYSFEQLKLGGREYASDEFSLFGLHNLANACMAWELAAAIAGKDLSLEPLREFHGLANRLELVGSKNDVRIYNNSMCTNPGAAIASSVALPGKQHLLMGGITKNLDFSPFLSYLESTPHRVYLFGEQNELASQLPGWPQFPSLKSAFDAAVEAARPGEIVALSPGCQSSQPYANFRERGDAFRAMAKEWLES